MAADKFSYIFTVRANLTGPTVALWYQITGIEKDDAPNLLGMKLSADMNRPASSPLLVIHAPCEITRDHLQNLIDSKDPLVTPMDQFIAKSAIS